MSDDRDHALRREAAAATAKAAVDITQRITDASEAMNSIVKSRTDAEAVAAKSELVRAVGAARDLGVSWQTIGDALGMRRGAAYQRFRQRTPTRRFDIHESPIDGVSVLAMRGELDALAVPRMVEAIESALASVPMGLIVDLLELTFLSSAGMTGLVEGDRSASIRGKQFGVVADGPATSRPMALMGLDRMLNVYKTIHDAMRGLHGRADADSGE